MQGLCPKQFRPILLEVFLSHPIGYQLVLPLGMFQLQRIFRGQFLFSMVDQQPTEEGAPFDDFVLGLAKDDLKGVLIDGVLAHRDEHLEGPGELFSITQKIRTILLKMLIESVKNGLKVQDFVVIVITGILNRKECTFSLMKS